MSFRWGDGFVALGELRLECRCLGPEPKAAMTLVLLHEGLGCVAMWRDFPERLVRATGCGVFAYSRAGYGHSDLVPLPRPLDYMTRAAQDDLPRLLDVIGVTRFVSVGHSDGATIAAIHAGTCLDSRLSGLVLIAPHFFTEPKGLAAIDSARHAYKTTDLRDRLARHHANPDVAFRGWNDAWLDPGFRDWNVEHVLDTIAVPTLAVQGQADQYGTLHQIDVVSDRLRAPAQRLVLQGCGHAPHRECPDALVDAITRFVNPLQL